MTKGRGEGGSPEVWPKRQMTINSSDVKLYHINRISKLCALFFRLKDCSEMYLYGEQGYVRLRLR